MGKTVAVSFEQDRVKIVHASVKGSSLSIKRVDVVNETEFDAYLKKDKASNYVVTCEFKESFHGSLTTPVVKSKYLEKIVESEIRKAINEKHLSFVYTPLGERVVDNKKVQEIFYYAVKSEEVRNIVGKFYDNGKTVSALYPSVFAVAAIMTPTQSDDARMGVYSAGKEKVAFFIQNGKIIFIRNYEAFDPGLTDFDITNINMTISYCFQNMRINPSTIFLMGDLTESSELTMLPSAPLASLYKGQSVQCENVVFTENILPIAALQVPKPSNILSREFKNIYMLKKYLKYSTRAFAALIILFFGFILFQVKGITDKKDSIQSALRAHQDLEILMSEYSEKKDGFQKFMPIISFLNKPSADIQNLLTALASEDLNGLSLNFIEAATKDNTSYSVVLKGTGMADSYSAIHSSFDSILKHLTDQKAIRIKSSSLDLLNKTFSIELDYGNQE